MLYLWCKYLQWLLGYFRWVAESTVMSDQSEANKLVAITEIHCTKTTQLLLFIHLLPVRLHGVMYLLIVEKCLTIISFSP